MNTPWGQPPPASPRKLGDAKAHALPGFPAPTVGPTARAAGHCYRFLASSLPCPRLPTASVLPASPKLAQILASGSAVGNPN